MNRYEKPPLVAHPVADAVLEAALIAGEPTVEPGSVLVGLALHDQDRAFVEQWCRRIARESRQPALIATASLCLGHLARRFRNLEPESVRLVEQLAGRGDLDSRVRSAVDDITFFLTPQNPDVE